MQKVRLAKACQQAGLPMEGIAAAIRAGRLSFAFLEASPYRRWAVRSARTYRQVSQETGVPLDLLRDTLESMGFPPAAPDELIREDGSERVAEAAPRGVSFVELGALRLEGIPRPVRVLEARPAGEFPGSGHPR